MEPSETPLAAGPSQAEQCPGLQEFPAATPKVLSAETVALDSLIHHRHSVDREMALEEVEKAFRDHRIDFLALVCAGRVTGLCARVGVGGLLGSRYGFPLFSKSPAYMVQVDAPLIVTRSTPVRRILDLALGRGADKFREDVVLVDDADKLLGLIPVEALAHLQMRLVGEQLGELHLQHEVMRRHNLELDQALHALRQAQGLSQGLLSGNTLGVALLDPRGRIHAHNQRLVDLLGGGEGEVQIISLDGWLSELDRLKFSQVLASHERESAAPVPITREFLLQLPARGARLFRFTTGWIRETGQICAYVDDITEQRNLERDVVRKEKQKLLDTLVGGIAHELNNKLTPVMGFAEMLADQNEPDRIESAKLIAKSTWEAAQIIRQLLQLSKPESGHLQSVDLVTVVQEALLMLKFQVREHSCELHLDLPPMPILVLADPAQIKQIVINLALNALQAMEDAPQPRLSIAVGMSDQRAFLTVTDNGTGILAENLGRIFDPFFTTKGPDRGSGLGLSICASIAREHGGEIAVDSQPGAGSAFTMTLPMEVSVVNPDIGAEAIPSQPAGSEPNQHGSRVLIVDDEEVVRLLLQEMMRSAFGCRTDGAANGAEALLLVERENFDLVISDIRMPVMGGTEFYLRLREVRPALARRFVFITGHPGDQSLQDEITRWRVPVVAKPFKISRLIEVCGPLLPQRESAHRSA